MKYNKKTINEIKRLVCESQCGEPPELNCSSSCAMHDVFATLNEHLEDESQKITSANS